MPSAFDIALIFIRTYSLFVLIVFGWSLLAFIDRYLDQRALRKMSKKLKTDPSLLPSKKDLGKRNPGRRSTRHTYVSASKLPPSEVVNFWKWEGAKQGCIFDDQGNFVDIDFNKVGPHDSHWTSIYPALRVRIMDMRARALHRERMAEVVKEIGK